MNKSGNKNKHLKKRADYGDTPILDGSFPLPEPRLPSIREGIEQSSDPEEVRQFAALGEAYKNASPRTLRKIRQAALQRIHELEAA